MRVTIDTIPPCDRHNCGLGGYGLAPEKLYTNINGLCDNFRRHAVQKPSLSPPGSHGRGAHVGILAYECAAGAVTPKRRHARRPSKLLGAETGTTVTKQSV